MTEQIVPDQEERRSECKDCIEKGQRQGISRSRMACATAIELRTPSLVARVNRSAMCGAGAAAAAPAGQANGAWRHDLRTKETIEERRCLRRVVRDEKARPSAPSGLNLVI